MREVAAVGFGMHPWGKFEDKSVTAASSRFAGGKGWGLNGNDVVEDMGATGVPVYNLSAGCSAGANAFNIGYTLVASGAHDMVMVVGGEKMPKGFIQTSGVEEQTDPEFLRQRCIGMPGPAFWAVLCRRRMHEHGTTEEQMAKVAVKARKNGALNPNARYRKETNVEEVLKSALVVYPLHLFEICAVSDGAAAVVLCSAEKAKQLTTKPVWVGGSAVATARFDDGITRGIGGMVPPGITHHSEAKAAVAKAMTQAGVGPKDLSLVELQDNTVYYELAFPEEWGLCEPGQAEWLLENDETIPTGKLPINPSGGFISFGEATTAQGLFQICELGWQLRGEAGARQVPNAKVAMSQTIGLGGNATAVVLKN